MNTIRGEQFAVKVLEYWAEVPTTHLLVLCIIKQIYQTYIKIVSWYRDIQGRTRCLAVKL